MAQGVSLWVDGFSGGSGDELLDHWPGQQGGACFDVPDKLLRQSKALHVVRRSSYNI